MPTSSRPNADPSATVDAPRREWDVVVAGAGLAGLAAALAARTVGASVLVLEAAPPGLRGGSTRLSDGIFSDRYEPDWGALERGLVDPDLPRALEEAAGETKHWLASHGIHLDEVRAGIATSGDDPSDTRLLQSAGGGRRLSSRLFDLARRHGIAVRYRARLIVVTSDRTHLAARVQRPESCQSIRCGAIVLATGGFGASHELRAKYLGAPWSSAKTAGSRFNRGDGLRAALELGGVATGDVGSCVAWPWEATSPPFGEPERPDVFRRLAGGLGLLVNQIGKRFVDELPDHPVVAAAQLARSINDQPGRIAFQILDGSIQPPILPASYALSSARSGTTVAELASQLAIPPAALQATVAAFNREMMNREMMNEREGGGPTSWSLRDAGAPRPLVIPPFVGYPVTAAVVSTLGGIRTSTVGHVLSIWDRPIPGLFAAGEIVGGLFAGAYPEGAALTAAAAFGRRAGLAAAKEALHLPPTLDPADPDAENRWLAARNGRPSAGR